MWKHYDIALHRGSYKNVQKVNENGCKQHGTKIGLDYSKTILKIYFSVDYLYLLIKFLGGKGKNKQ